MAGGWAKDGAVQEQIDASIADEMARLRAKRGPVGESLTECAECGEENPGGPAGGAAGREAVRRLRVGAGRARGAAWRDQPAGVERTVS